MFRIFAFIFLSSSTAASAQNYQSMQLATDLGTVIGSERACNLAFDQEAIERWIDENVDASDMGFPGTLTMMIEGTEFQLQSTAGSALTAHCRAVQRTARHYGFIQ